MRFSCGKGFIYSGNWPCYAHCETRVHVQLDDGVMCVFPTSDSPHQNQGSGVMVEVDPTPNFTQKNRFISLNDFYVCVFEG